MGETGAGPIDYAAALDRARQLLDRPGRALLGITGAPGVGKTSFAERLAADLNAERAGIAAHVPMDGYHLADSTLDRLGRRDRKGAIDTFDGWGYASLLVRLTLELDTPVYAPDFDRRLEQPIAGSIEVGPAAKIVVSEGNYLLALAAPWAALAGLFTEVWFCTVPEEVRMRRLVERHIRFGRSRAAAEAWATDVDGVNARLIESKRSRATIEVSTE